MDVRKLYFLMTTGLSLASFSYGMEEREMSTKVAQWKNKIERACQTSNLDELNRLEQELGRALDTSQLIGYEPVELLRIIVGLIMHREAATKAQQRTGSQQDSSQSTTSFFSNNDDDDTCSCPPLPHSSSSESCSDDDDDSTKDTIKALACCCVTIIAIIGVTYFIFKDSESHEDPIIAKLCTFVQKILKALNNRESEKGLREAIDHLQERARTSAAIKNLLNGPDCKNAIAQCKKND